MREIGGTRLSKGVASPAEGRSVGIMILWNSFEVEEVVEDRHVGRGAISLYFKDVKDDFSWDFSRVDEPQKREGKRIL